MERADVKRSIERALHELQEISGESDADIKEDTCPVDDLGFDSIRTVEASIYVGEALGCADYEKTLDLFKPTPENPIVTVGTIVDRACGLVKASTADSTQASEGVTVSPLPLTSDSK